MTSAIVDWSSGSDVNVSFLGVTPPYVRWEWVWWFGWLGCRRGNRFWLIYFQRGFRSIGKLILM